jgi:hypothetical protein
MRRCPSFSFEACERGRIGIDGSTELAVPVSGRGICGKERHQTDVVVVKNTKYRRFVFT